jgi:D-alanine transaminase
MSKTEILYLNGEWMPIGEGRVSAEDRGFNFGDGVYEVMRAYGGEPFTLTEHLERQERSAAGLGIRIPLSVPQFSDVVRELLSRSGIPEALIYTQVTRGAAPRQHIYADDLKPTVMAFVRPTPVQPKAWRTEGAKAIPEPDIRWELCNLKTISLLPNILAKNRAHRAGAAEALFHMPDGTVTEGSSSNAYAIRGGELWTAPLGPRILPGITRMQILQIAQEIGIRVHEEALSLREFEAADEIIMSATNLELLPITRLDENAIGAGKPGPVYRRLHEAYRARVRERCGVAELVPL